MDKFRGMFFALVVGMVCIIGAATVCTVTIILNQAEQITNLAESNNTETETTTSSMIEVNGDEETTEESCDESASDDTIAFLVCLIFILNLTGLSSRGCRW